MHEEMKSQVSSEISNHIIKMIEEDTGSFDLNSASWQSFLDGFKSRNDYEIRVRHFKRFHDDRCGQESDLKKNLIEYFDEHHSIRYEDGEAIHAPTSLRTRHSILKKIGYTLAEAIF